MNAGQAVVLEPAPEKPWGKTAPRRVIPPAPARICLTYRPKYGMNWHMISRLPATGLMHLHPRVVFTSHSTRTTREIT